MATKDKFEEDILSDVILANDIGVHFEDIGALENVKDTLKKLVMVPLQRPELFCKGRLRKVLPYTLIGQMTQYNIALRHANVSYAHQLQVYSRCTPTNKC